MGRGLALPITFVYCNPGREYSHVCIEQVTVNEILEELLSWRAEKMETQDKCEPSVCRWPTPAIPALTGESALATKPDHFKKEKPCTQQKGD